MIGLEITLKIGCVNNCSYCPQDKLLAAYPKKDSREMDFENFKVFMQKIPKNVQIHFSGFCEPFTHKHFGDFVDVAYTRGNYIVIYSTLRWADYYSLKDLRGKYNEFWVHLPNYEEMEIGKSFLTDWITNIRALEELKMPVNFIRVGDTPLLEEIECEVENKFIYYQRQIERATNKIYAEYPFKCIGNRYNQGVLLPNGDIALCCEDYGLNHILGNLHKNTYEEIYKTSSERKKIVEAMNGEKRKVICVNCNRCKAYDRQ